MFSQRFRTWGLLLLSFSLLFCGVSCSAITTFFDGNEDQKITGKNGILRTPKLPEDAVSVDIYKIRVPYSKRELLANLWERADEHDIPIETRKELYRNGLRAGTLGSSIPIELSRLLELRDQPVTSPTEEKLRNAADEMKNPRLATRYSMTVQKGVPVLIETCEPLERLSLFANVNGEGKGQTYHNAFGVLQLSCQEQLDGSVKMKIVPEIHFGEVVTRTISQGGIMHKVPVHPKHTFDKMAIESHLLLGQWLIIGPNGESFGFGNRIFVQEMGDPEQRLIAIRIVQTQHDGIHDRNDIATLDWIPDENMKSEQKYTEQDHEDQPISLNMTP